MKKKFLTWGLLLSSAFAHAQKKQDTVYKKQQLSQTDVQVLFSYYSQDGDHSAITGGKGTEKLQVYAPECSIAHHPDSLNTYKLSGGVDVVTSASHDNIDYSVSSASRVDTRIHISVGYERKIKNTGTTLGANIGFSIESAYLSYPVGLSFDHVSKSGSREINIGLQTYFDDLRWGRLDPDYYHPVTVVYPVELRYKQWDTGYRRNSYNLNIAFYQVINRRMQFAIFPDVVYQKGLLSTPFHRVYFNDGITEKVEHLPSERWKFPIGFQLNIFATNNFIVRSFYRFYHDNFGINAHTFQLETPVKLSPMLTISPHARYYFQSATTWFQPLAMHNIAEQYYTSDYDLSKFSSYELGLALRYTPQAAFLRHYFFKEVELRYVYYKRSDQLSANIISVLFDVNRTVFKK